MPRRTVERPALTTETSVPTGVGVPPVCSIGVLPLWFRHKSRNRLQGQPYQELV